MDKLLLGLKHQQLFDVYTLGVGQQMENPAGLAACNQLYSGRILDGLIPDNWKFTVYISAVYEHSSHRP
jgi:hypothetical protein